MQTVYDRELVVMHCVNDEKTVKVTQQRCCIIFYLIFVAAWPGISRQKRSVHEYETSHLGLV